jgi:endonuclease/exonuclease/phosphatase family metal-dependent hydrolase
MLVRLVTWNVAGVGHDWRRTRSAVAAQGLAPLAPDVLCLQETTVVIGADAYDQAQELGAALGLFHVAFSPYGNPAEAMSHEQGGIAVLSRWPFKTVHNRRLPSAHAGHPDARVAQFVTLCAPEGDVHVVNTHLSWRPEEAEIRLVQTGLILEEMASFGWLAPGRRSLLAGDLNATDDEPAIQLAADRLVDAWSVARAGEAGHTWLHANSYGHGLAQAAPDRRLDYVLAPRDARVLGADIVLEEKTGGVGASDHFGVGVTVEWTD